MRTICRAALISSVLCLAGGEAAAAGAPHGFWKCSMGKRGVYLAVLPGGVLSFDGAAARYKVTGSALQVQQDGRWVDYPYALTRKGKALSITMPGNQRLACKPVSLRGVASLQGMLCSWSGSSSSYAGTSISRSTRVHFDGRGNLSYHSEGGFSGPSGLYANRSKAQRGMYRILGNTILLVFPDGDGGVAQVHMRQNSGRITEVKYQGTLFAAGLCK